MLGWLKDIVVPVRMHDARFGAMRYLRDARFWEGKAAFDPTGSEVEVLIWAEASGPREEQRAFFEDLQRRYGSVWPGIRDKLAAEAQRVGASASEFDLVTVGIPQQPGEGAEWVMSYETRPPSWHFTVRLRGWVPREIIAEG